MSALNKGQRVADRYVLLSRLTRTTHAEVWLAQDLEARAKVVIKIASAEGDEAHRARALLANEFDIGRRFNHPSIVLSLIHI